jgi:hypothetical protein
VSQWADKSGRSHHALASTVEARPSFSTDRLVFDGSGNCLTLENHSDFNTLFYFAGVVKGTISAAYCGLLDKVDNGIGWYIDFGGAGNIGTPRLGANNTSVMAASSVSGSKAIISAQLNGSDSFVGNPVNMELGSLAVPGINSQGIIIGGDNASTLRGTMDVHEIILLPSYPTVVVRQKIEGYLAHKWGLTSNLNSIHPYKTSPPYLTALALEGIVRLNGSHAQADVFVYESATGEFRAKIQSSAVDGSYKIEDSSGAVLVAEEQYFVLCNYGEGVRPLAHGPVAPTVVDV